MYTLPSKLRDIAYQNKRVVYDLLMKAAAETTLAIAADPKRLGARIGVTAVLHTWGSTLTHHPHVHMIVPGGGLSLDGARWVACRSNFLVHVNLLARLFSGKMLAMLADAHGAGQLRFFNTHAGLADQKTFKRFIAPLRRIKWVVYCKAPFAGPKQVLRYLSRYTHRVAISNRRLVAADEAGVAFRWKDYRIDGPGRWKTMRLHPHEFIKRFLLHVLPRGFHRIRYYGLLASANRAESIATARALLGADPPAVEAQKPHTIVGSIATAPKSATDLAVLMGRLATPFGGARQSGRRERLPRRHPLSSCAPDVGLVGVSMGRATLFRKRGVFQRNGFSTRRRVRRLRSSGWSSPPNRSRASTSPPPTLCSSSTKLSAARGQSCVSRSSRTR